MSQDEITKMFKYMQEMRKEISAQFEETNQKIDKVHTILDKHTAMLETDETERIVLGAQVGRHEDWVQRTASKVGVRYSPAS